MGSNEWFEYDLAEDGGQTGTTESLPVSGVQTIMGLQNSGAKIVHRSVLLCCFPNFGGSFLPCSCVH